MNPRVPVVVALAVLAEVLFAFAFVALGNLAAATVVLLLALVIVFLGIFDIAVHLEERRTEVLERSFWDTL